jgi:hypothetical protein
MGMQSLVALLGFVATLIAIFTRTHYENERGLFHQLTIFGYLSGAIALLAFVTAVVTAHIEKRARNASEQLGLQSMYDKSLEIDRLTSQVSMSLISLQHTLSLDEDRWPDKRQLIDLKRKSIRKASDELLNYINFVAPQICILG